MAILGNLLVMVAVCRDRQLRKIKTNYFIVSLAFADLLVSVLVMPFGAIELVQDIWIYGEMFCLVRTSLDVLLTTASIFHLCCISLDRYYAICCQPLVYRNKMTPLRIALMLGGCWVIPMFISFLPIMQGWNNIGIIDLEGIPKPRLGEDLHVIEKRKFPQSSNSTYCVFMVNKPYAITCSVVAFYIPFLLMVLAYYRIYVTAKEHAHQIQMLQRAGAPSEGRPQPTDQHSTHRMRTETKAAKTLCIIMGCFCLCWAPFFVTNIVDPFVDYTVPGQVWTAFLWLGYINSGLNPFLYAFLNKSFRRAFLIILCCDDERYRRPSILGQTVPCSTTTINGSTHVLREEGREIETSMREKHRSAASSTSPTGDVPATQGTAGEVFWQCQEEQMLYRPTPVQPSAMWALFISIHSQDNSFSPGHAPFISHGRNWGRDRPEEHSLRSNLGGKPKTDSLPRSRGLSPFCFEMPALLYS
ncbi:5-hydroxytryptamine receptor 4 [Myotis davidii]|uniref:5-hydroxytryptamine receptor 4 n=1 Tax=Myotis davidii TaxID=225400 RepID=L5LPC1_MYODS|nr:5-hydroxytryptamine receptor 4 [Myotis davidii]